VRPVLLWFLGIFIVVIVLPYLFYFFYKWLTEEAFADSDEAGDGPGGEGGSPVTGCMGKSGPRLGSGLTPSSSSGIRTIENSRR
jgi:hypothetical protein